jgi:hypothetical protein
MLHELAKETNKWLIGGSMPERDSDGKLYNTWSVCTSISCLLVFWNQGKLTVSDSARYGIPKAK